MQSLELSRSLIARESEMGRLQNLLRRAMEGKGGLVLISGEAGIGKTRLAAELMQYAESLKVKVLFGRSVPHNLSPYLIFEDALEEFFDIKPTDTTSTKGKKIARAVREAAPEIVDAIPILSDLVKVPKAVMVAVRKYRGEEPEPKARRERLFESVSQLLLKSSRRTPILMVLDDLQWADPSSIALLHYLARSVESVPSLIVGTYRTEELEEEGLATFLDTLRLMHREGLVEEVSLDRLGPSEVKDLLRESLRSDPPEHLVQILNRETEGNPLFLVEALKLMIQEGFLRRGGDSWKLERPLVDLLIPKKVHAIVIRRIDSLPPNEREVLDCASVIGDQFESQLLERVLRSQRPALLRLLGNLEKRHRLVRYAKGRYQFDHSKIRDILYAELGDELRQQYHAEVAENLERLSTDDSDTILPSIAYHYLMGGMGSKALPYYLRAAEVARKKYANEEAILHLRQVLKLASAQQVSIPAEESSTIHEALGDASEGIGDLPEALKAYRNGLKEAREPERLARLHRKIASALQVRGEVEQASREVDNALRALGDRACEERGWVELVRCNTAEGREDWKGAKQYAESALESFRSFKVGLGEAQVLQELGRVETFSSGDPSVAEKYLMEALDKSALTADSDFIASVHTTLAHLYAYRLGNVDKAASHLAAVERQPQTLHDPHKRRALLMLKGWFDLKLRADYAAAERDFAEALVLAQKIHDASTDSFARYGLAHVALYQGRVDESRKSFEQFAIGGLGQEWPGYRVEAIYLAAECCLLQGDIDGFRKLLQILEDPELTVIAKSRPVPAKILDGINRTILGDKDGSRSVFDEAVGLSEKESDVEETALVHFAYGVVLRAIGENREGEEHLNLATELLKNFSRTGILATIPLRERLLVESLRRACTSSCI